MCVLGHASMCHYMPLWLHGNGAHAHLCLGCARGYVHKNVCGHGVNAHPCQPCACPCPCGECTNTCTVAVHVLTHAHTHLCASTWCMCFPVPRVCRLVHVVYDHTETVHVPACAYAYVDGVHTCVAVMPVHVLALPMWVVCTQVHCSGACALPCPCMCPFVHGGSARARPCQSHACPCMCECVHRYVHGGGACVRAWVSAGMRIYMYVLDGSA